MWQCISAQVPYSLEDVILKDTTECEAIRKQLRDSYLPGQLEEDGDASRFMDIIRQCWRRDPMYRTTADTVARTLQELCASVVLQTSGIEKSLMEDVENRRSAVDGDLDRIQQGALQAVQEARLLNKDAAKLLQSTSRIKSEDFRVLFDQADSSNPVASFIIGAALWWNIADFPFEEAGDTSTRAVALTYEGK
jgi:hypothetical protein